MKIRYSAVRHNISVGNDGCVSVLFHTGQNISSLIISTHIQALTGWNGNIVNRAVRHNISVEKKATFCVVPSGTKYGTRFRFYQY
ncbi:MAG: hypothetical protein IPM47_04595 [Sphingobacteriales bacterium]|nr:MAG: hypothetical protein IPM47_04595 [Sphingobacteriales bacterium]